MTVLWFPCYHLKFHLVSLSKYIRNPKMDIHVQQFKKKKMLSYFCCSWGIFRKTSDIWFLVLHPLLWASHIQRLYFTVRAYIQFLLTDWDRQHLPLLKHEARIKRFWVLTLALPLTCWMTLGSCIYLFTFVAKALDYAGFPLFLKIVLKINLPLFKL